ncbi:MAG: hypothetical protein JNK56_19530 [Myxococcales bacterium]|nr:hypothetical protein [Myxococcales bacterium]
MTRSNDPRPRALSLATIDVEVPEDIARAAKLLIDLAAHGGRAEIPVLARSVVKRSWPEPLRRRVSATIAAILRRQGVMALRTLEPQLRRSPWHHRAETHPQHFGGDWLKLDASTWSALIDEGDPHLACVLGLLSCHNNGYVREAAVRTLAARSEGLPWLLLRVNDWVPAVRMRATTALVERLTAGHVSALLECLPLVWRLRELTRLDHRDLVTRIVAALADLSDEILTAALDHEDRWVRRAVLQLLVERGRITLPQIGRALDDVDLAVRLRAAELVPSDATTEAEALRERLCGSCNSRLRSVGLERMAEAHSDRLAHWIEQGLDDRAAAVRETAQFLARTGRSQVALAARYQGKLAAGELKPGHALGLAETGIRDDWEHLVAALAGPPAVACAAISGLKTLAASETRELRLLLVDDPRPSVSRHAARSVQWEIGARDEDTLREYLGSPLAHVRRHAMRLAERLPGCRPGLLLLALEREPVEHVALAAALHSWLRELAQPYQVEVTTEEATLLRELLAVTTRLDPGERQRAIILLGIAPR